MAVATSSNSLRRPRLKVAQATRSAFRPSWAMRARVGRVVTGVLSRPRSRRGWLAAAWIPSLSGRGRARRRKPSSPRRRSSYGETGHGVGAAGRDEASSLPAPWLGPPMAGGTFPSCRPLGALWHRHRNRPEAGRQIGPPRQGRPVRHHRRRTSRPATLATAVYTATRAMRSRPTRRTTIHKAAPMVAVTAASALTPAASVAR